MKSLKIFLFLGAGILLFLGVQAWADVPRLINFQGILTDASGNPKADDTVNVQFKIYDAAVGGNVKWTETRSVITDADGLFNILLGSVTPMSDTVFYDTLSWLGIKVGADPEMSPRQQIASVGYAYKSLEADTAEYARVAVSDGDWTINGNDIYHLNGNVGIGTTGPNGFLDIRRSDSKGIRFGNSGDHPGVMDGMTSTGANGILYLNLNSIGNVILANGGGNVGIGTTSPTAKLHVNGGGIRVDEGDISIANTHDAALSLDAPATYQTYINIYKAGVRKWNVMGADINGTWVWRNEGLSGVLALQQGGNVGIGTTSPTQKLEVAGGIQAAFFTTANDAGALYRLKGQNVDGSYADLVNPGGGAFRIKVNNGATDAVSILNSGNVGIGTTGPAVKLHVNRATSGSQIAFGTDEGYLWSYTDGSRNVAGISANADISGASWTAKYTSASLISLDELPGEIHFFLDTGLTAGNPFVPTTRLKLKPTELQFQQGTTISTTTGNLILSPSGNVGIGTTSPTQKLEVAGTVYSTSGGFKFPDGSVQTTAASGSGIPTGVIVMWSGTLATIPSGWALCDGSNGTPNLTEKFIYGVSAGQNPGPTGGSTSHFHTVNPPGTGTSPAGATGVESYSPNSSAAPAYHSHSVDIDPFFSVSSDHLPPYYKLAFIMKL